MQYLLLIYNAEANREGLSENEQQRIYGEFAILIDELKQSGNYLGGHELQPVATATTVRKENGKKSVTDGPFAETKEQLGGYFLIQADDLDRAIEIAARIPEIGGSVEVRPVVMR